MFYDLSKLLWPFLTPSRLLIWLFCLGAVVLTLGFLRTGRTLLGVGGVAYIACAFGPVGVLLTHALETRFPAQVNGAAPDGIIMLGGNITESYSVWRGELIASPLAPRLIETLVLAQRFASAKVVCACGDKAAGEAPAEAESFRTAMLEAGVDPARLVVEPASRNTYENGVFTARLVHPAPTQRWLLVTSALHMPRAVGVFRRAGFSVLAAPAHFATPQALAENFTWMRRPRSGMILTDYAVREWLGLVAYRITGRTDALFPAP